MSFSIPPITMSLMKRQAGHIHHFLISFITILICLSFSTVFTKLDAQTKNSFTKTLAPSFYPLPFLSITPSPTPVLLPFQQFQTSITENASQSGEILPEAASDYCINVPVILYHHIQPLPIASLLGHETLTVDSAIFDQQIKYLKDYHYHAATADELVQALESHHQLPDKSVIITIDDGYDDNYTYAFLTAKKYQFVMNFMIPTELIGQPGYMNWDHLREMQQNKYARLYNHTATHAALGLINREEIDKELDISIDDFQKQLGYSTQIFVYPYGSYNQTAIDALKAHGFIAAFTTDPGIEECLSNIMQLRRVRVGNASMSSYGY